MNIWKVWVRAMRNSLIEMIRKELMDYASWKTEMALQGSYNMPSVEEVIADKIIANGWSKPICSVGDTLWVVYKNKVYPVTIYAVRTDNKKNNKRICVEGNFHICEPYGNYTHYYSSTFNMSSIGKSIFNTEEDALKSLNK